MPKKARRKKRVLIPPVKEEILLSPAVYRTIRVLVDMSSSERGLVLSIVKGLTS